MGMFPGGAGYLGPNQPQIAPGQTGQNSAMDPAKLAQLMMAIRQTKLQESQVEKKNAQMAVETTMKLVESGVNLSPEMAKALDKNFKILGIDVGSMDKTLGTSSLDPTAESQGGGGQQPNVSGAIGGGPVEGAQAGTPGKPYSGKPGGGGVTTGGGSFAEVLNGIASSARAKSMSEGMKATLNQGVTQMQMQMADPRTSEEDRNRIEGQVYRLGESMGTFAFNIDGHTFFTGDAKHQNAMMDKAAGFETDIERNQRIDKIAESIKESYPNPSDAYSVAKDLVAGKTPSVKAPYNWAPYKNMLDVHLKNIEAGIDSDVSWKMVNGVKDGANPVDLVPGKLHPALLQRLGFERMSAEAHKAQAAAATSQAQTERYRLEMEGEKAILEFKINHERIMAGITSDLHKSVRDTFVSAVEAKKAGAPLPADIMQGLYDSIAKLPGVDLQRTDVQSWWEKLTGAKGTKAGYQPIPPGPGTQKILDQGIGSNTVEGRAASMVPSQARTTAEPKAAEAPPASTGEEAGRMAAKTVATVTDPQRLMELAKSAYMKTYGAAFKADIKMKQEMTKGFLEFLASFMKGYQKEKKPNGARQ